MPRLIKLSTYIFLLLFAIGCRKSDNPKLPELERVPVPLYTIDETMDVIIQDPAQFKAKFMVDLYFSEDVKPKKMDIVVARNGDYANVKLFKADVTTYPTTVEVTGQQLATLFGIQLSDIKPGDTYEFGSDLTLQSGKVIPMFSPTGIGYGTGITNLPNASVLATYRAVCPLDISVFAGPATIQDPDFWGSNYPVTVAVEGTDVLRITGLFEDPSAVLRVTIVNKTQTAIVEEQKVANELDVYHNAFAEGAGVVDACNNKINLNLTYWVDEGNFGAYPLTLVK